ncbi:MAG: sugar ABC transporter permease [Lachnospiraceae bacterium]|jgi:arabinogalactan oligomer/maltooligosaccharide transport system permease protein|nr:sugar ABC transporter permease [Lachnospiraceae bacterium]
MKNKKKLSGNYFKDFGTAVAKGDMGVKLSLLVMGAGYFARKQIINGLIMIALEIVFIMTCVFYAAPNLAKFGTLGTVQFEQVFDPLTMTSKVNDYDNSFLILLNSIIALFIILIFILVYIGNIKAVYRLQVRKEEGKHINTFREDIRALFNEKFHITLLTLPCLGIILMNIIPILVLVAVAFTNYDQQHMPPSALFTWVGWKNFKQLFTNSTTVTFGYSFGKILIWTLEWALLATLTTFIGGILMAQFINNKKTKLPKLWRTLFMVAIAVPQFVTLLLVRNFFADSGIVNTICSNIGLTDFLKSIGLVNSNLTYIPFLTNPTWAKVMIVLINIWVGVPYQMLIATGVLMNIPVDQLESARIDGANSFQIFWKITMPYVLFITGPSLITDFVKNINNFNVIYLLTQDVYVTSDQLLANSNAKEVDLLVTWLFRLTNEYYNYKIASVIGILVFIICAAFTLITFTQTIKGNREEDFR